MELWQKLLEFGSAILIRNLRVLRSAQSVTVSSTPQTTAFLALLAKHANTNFILLAFINGFQHLTNHLARCVNLPSEVPPGMMKFTNFAYWLHLALKYMRINTFYKNQC